MEMIAKKVKRKCDVRRCRNTDCYSISYCSESGATVIICADCIAKANELINLKKEAVKPSVKKTEKPAEKPSKAEKSDEE